MNDELQKQLAEMLAKLTSTVENSASWMAGQIPPLVQEKILFGRISETLLLLLLAVVCCVLFVLCRRCVLRLIDSKYDDEMGWILGTALTGGGAVLSLGAFGLQLNTTVMVWFAPRLYVVEWLASLVHK